jgi:hypothetical protein
MDLLQNRLLLDLTQLLSLPSIHGRGKANLFWILVKIDKIIEALYYLSKSYLRTHMELMGCKASSIVSYATDLNIIKEFYLLS